MRTLDAARKYVFFGSLLMLVASVVFHAGFATDVAPIEVPEPGILGLLAAVGVAGVAASLVRRRKNKRE